MTLRRLRSARPIVAAFLEYLTGPRATDSFRQRGMLIVDEVWSTVPRPQAQPPAMPEPPPIGTDTGTP